MITLAVQSILVLGLAFAAAALIHRRTASLHRLLWLTVFVALALLPALGRIPRFVAVDAPAVVAPLVVNVTDAAAAPRDWVFLIWAVGCALFLLRIVAGLSVIAWRTAQAVPSPFQVAGGRVLLSPHIDSPFTWGVFRHTILLPLSAGEWPDEQLRSTLVHETVHVSRRDASWRLLSQIACAFYWPNPLAWLAAGRLHVAMEQSCDDAVLETGIGARRYAGHLLDISRAASLGDVAAGTVAMAGAAQLEARLRSILDESRLRTPTSRAASLAAALAVLAVLAPLGITRLTAQNSGKASLSGIVTDASGGRVPKALVTLAEATSGRVEAAYSADDGTFRFTAIPAGKYTVQVRKAGFAPFVEREPIDFKEGAAANMVAQLRVGQIQEMIEVAGERVAPKPQVAGEGAPMRIRIGGNVQAAKLLKMVKPAYPDVAKARNAEGPVLMRATITRDGSVESLDLLNTSADPDLAEAAMAAVRQWKYQTTLLNGEPVGVVTEITVNFTLGN
ncbi:MAG: M56 family metallopeptidase [Acidobacteriota bacterium]